MKKLVFILAFLMANIMCSAQGGLFQRGEEPELKKNEVFNNRVGSPGLPGHEGQGNQSAPVGAGTALLIGFGAAYALYKKKSEK